MGRKEWVNVQHVGEIANYTLLLRKMEPQQYGVPNA
jgi:hypothetical protein